jgi:hypothetical protein
MKIWHIAMISMLIISMILAGTATATEIEITKPVDGDNVDTTQSIEGTSKDITDFQQIWIAVYIPSINRYYLQDKRSLGFNNLANGEWGTRAIIGGPNDSGREFQLLAILADENANNIIIEYLDKCNKDEEWPGMENLPAGVAAYDKVTVNRK